MTYGKPARTTTRRTPRILVAGLLVVIAAIAVSRTRDTDPSGYDDATVSTAADQVRIVDRAMRLPVFASIVATPSATLPVAGTVRNTNSLLGHNGFVGVKTGSDDAAAGATIIMITHDAGLTDQLPRQIRVLDGQVVSDTAKRDAP